MPDLTELLRLAEGALAHGEMIGESSWYAVGTIAALANRGANGMTAVSEPDDAYIAAMDPDTAKKLIAVALAALDLHESVMSLALSDALERLK